MYVNVWIKTYTRSTMKIIFACLLWLGTVQFVVWCVYTGATLLHVYHLRTSFVEGQSEPERVRRL